MNDMIFDSGHLYVRVAGAIIKVDAATMEEVGRYRIAEEAIEVLRRMAKRRDAAEIGH